MKRISALIGFTLFALLAVPSVSAHHKAEVLGETTDAPEVIFPPVTAGPGYILPDSPLFFVDQMKQTVRLFFASTASEKAQIHSEIAGERIAELRIMLSKNNMVAADTAMSLLSHEIEASARSLSEAAAKGENVTKLALTINQGVKQKRDTLTSAADHASGSLQLKLEALTASLNESKNTIEDNLSQDELEKETQENLAFVVAGEVKGVTTATGKVERALSALEKSASTAAERRLNEREALLKKAAEKKQLQLQKRRALLLEQARKKQEQLAQLRKKAEEQAREALKRAEEARRKLLEVQNQTQEIENEPLGND